MPNHKTAVSPQKNTQRQFTLHDKIILFATLGYLLIISAFMIWHQEFFSPDRFFVFLFIGMILVGRAWMFLWDWLPPIMLILGYDYLRGLVPQIITKVHIHAMMDFDKLLFFGTVPTIDLQHLLWHGTVRWWDNVAVVMYFLHFIVPLIMAFVLWLTDHRIFKQYMAAMVVLSYTAFVTYYIFPAMPPWMASQQGFLPPLAHVTDAVLASFAHPINLPTVYNYVGANLVAAVPSLHAAYPLMMAMFVNKKWPKWGKTAFVYPALMWITVIYLGEHYFFDVCAGISYVLIIYAMITNWRNTRTSLKNLFLNFYFKYRPEVNKGEVSNTL